MVESELKMNEPVERDISSKFGNKILHRPISSYNICLYPFVLDQPWASESNALDQFNRLAGRPILAQPLDSLFPCVSRFSAAVADFLFGAICCCFGAASLFDASTSAVTRQRWTDPAAARSKCRVEAHAMVIDVSWCWSVSSRFQKSQFLHSLFRILVLLGLIWLCWKMD